MNSSIFDQVPKGTDLTQAVDDLEKQYLAEHKREHIKKALKASRDINTPRTSHAEFMSELKTALMSKINER